MYLEKLTRMDGGLDPKEEFRSKYVSKSVIYVSPP